STSLRDGDGKAAAGAGQGTQGDGRLRRPQRKDPHLQLSAKSRDRSSHRSDTPPARRRGGRQTPADHRRAGHSLPGGKAETTGGSGGVKNQISPCPAVPFDKLWAGTAGLLSCAPQPRQGAKGGHVGDPRSAGAAVFPIASTCPEPTR